MAEASDNRQPLSKNQLGLAAVVIVVVIAVAFGLYFLLKSSPKPNQSSNGNTKYPAISAEFLSAGAMRTEFLTDKKKEPFAWAGGLPRLKTEFRRTAHGDVYVRYMPRSARLGESGDYLVIATYPFNQAVNGLRAQAKSAKAKVRHVNGAVIYVDPKRPRHVYMALSSYDSAEIEVFAPTATAAINLAKSGKIHIQQ